MTPHTAARAADTPTTAEHHIGQYVVTGTASLTTALRAIRWAERRGYHSGRRFTCRGQRVRVWLRGHHSHQQKRAAQ